MKKSQFEYRVQVWFCGGPGDEGLDAKKFKATVEGNWVKLQGSDSIRLDHIGVGDTRRDDSDTQNWQLAFDTAYLDTSNMTVEILEGTILKMLDQQKPSLPVQVEITSAWHYR
jgi:hypothetical protein